MSAWALLLLVELSWTTASLSGMALAAHQAALASHLGVTHALQHRVLAQVPHWKECAG